MTRSHRTALATAALAAVLLAACRPETTDTTDTAANTADDRSAALPASVLAPLVAAQTHREVATFSTPRLADGLTPPTNRWFSGLVFPEQPQPVFPLPLAFTLDDDGFGFGLPQVVTGPTSIVGSHQEDVSVRVDGAAGQQVAAYDDGSVTFAVLDASGVELGRTTVAEGSPFVSYLATGPHRLITSTPFVGDGALAVAETPTGTYAVRLTNATVDGQHIDIEAAGSMVFYPVPAGHAADELAAYAHPVTGATADFDVGPDEVSTTLSYRTVDGEPTAVGLLPHQQSGDLDECTLGTFPTAYGTLTLCPGSELTWSAPRLHPALGLDLSGLSATNRADLADQVAADLATSPDPPTDSYFGGKAAYRLAQLLDIADQVGARAAADDASTRLSTLLTRWTEPQGCAARADSCFVYDPAWKGMVGLAAAFGSEEFNDHHFHFGYFLYAAAVLAAHDPSVVDRLRPVMTLLAADIAGGSDTGITPRWRVFDPYAGHSWASGTAPFADGNNQESTSEAVTAWAGLALWARVIDDTDLADEAVWLMSAEAASAAAYWTSFDLADPVYAAFGHHVIGIGWGGKRDYATWFSPAPQAILGIQLIPMSPSSDYLATDPDRIAANVAEATTDGGFEAPLGDYILMYSALAGPDAAREALATARDLPPSAIDDGDSRSYLLAYLMSHTG